MKVLKVAIENQRWDLAAHALVVGLVETTIKESNGKARRPAKKSKRS